MAFGPHRPVLGKGRGAFDGGCVDSPLGPDFVGGAVTLEVAVARRVSVVGWVVNTGVFDHVVLGQWVSRPPVQTEVYVCV